MGLRGTVKGNLIELEHAAGYPDGTTVEVEVTPVGEASARTSGAKGSPRAVLAALRGFGGATREEVSELMRVIGEARQPTDFGGVFDRAPRAPRR